ncbi:rolling circle replication-associated protein [Paracoccus sp. KR1-242]|uniref:rolling circle replication-associated protein n=1 Tax=Paracoccus sp. KR1-242 TaxID=3410028 RepID=UPI003BFF901A
MGYERGGYGNAGPAIYVACRGCRVCRENRVNDLIGRCVAEERSSSSAVSVTLTYAGDVPEAALLKYSDVQKFLKRLRKAIGYQPRYLCAGEYGTANGRAHWHIIIFFRGKEPVYELEKEKYNWPFWPKGFAYFRKPNGASGYAYVCKYALKEEQAVKALSMSKKPPLGYDFFMQLASDLVDRGLPVQSPEYRFANVVNKKGKARTYWLQGRMREMFLERYCEVWAEKNNGDMPPLTDFLLESYLDPLAKARMEQEPEDFEREREIKQARYDELERLKKARWRHELGFMVLGGRDMIVAYSDGTADVYLGDDLWQVAGSNENVAAQLSRLGFEKLRSQRVSAWLTERWLNQLPSKGQ